MTLPDTNPSASAPAPTGIDDQMMVRALSLAHAAAELGEVPVGAVVYETSTGRILGEAHNRRECDNDPLGHAELLAIRAAALVLGDWRLTACTLVVTLEPCAMCAGAIVNARIGRLVYGATDPKAGACESLHTLTTDPRLNHRVVPIGGLRAAESATMLKAFFARLRTARP
ncbi:MAG: nucleoside deaminase [Phycisphaerales bacterium]